MEKLQSIFRLGQRAENAKEVFFDEELVDQDVLNISNQCTICLSSMSENEQLKENVANVEEEEEDTESRKRKTESDESVLTKKAKVDNEENLTENKLQPYLQ